jgi:hypothetical protein
LNRRRSQLVAVAFLCALIVLLGPTSPARALSCAPAFVAALIGLHPPPRWGLPVAILMLPYFSYGVMDALVDVNTRTTGILIAVTAIGAFLGGMDSLRRA